MLKDNFLNELMMHIIEGVKIPKVQVERAITPILSLFIESVLNEYFKTNHNYSGSYKIVSPEFPLKKANNQSTNIDYLLVNSSKNILVLFELKTDISSMNSEQLNRYLDYKNQIVNSSSYILKKNLLEISKASKKSLKYDYVISKFDSVIKNPEGIKSVIIIYLVPNAIKNSIKQKDKIDFVLNYSDLPQSINHKYSNQWKIVRDNFLKLDEYFQSTKDKKQNYSLLDIVVQNIKEYIKTLNKKVFPERVWVGATGKGLRPNYQVKFSDGSIKTFYFSGKSHRVKKFKINNLGEEHLWTDIK